MYTLTDPSSYQYQPPPAPDRGMQAAPAETVLSIATSGSPQNNRVATVGVAGAAIGFGAGLIVAELLVTGLVLAAVGVIGWLAAGRISRLVKRH